MGRPRCAVVACPNKAHLCDYHAPRSCGRAHVDDNDSREEREQLLSDLARVTEERDDEHGAAAELARIALELTKKIDLVRAEEREACARVAAAAATRAATSMFSSFGDERTAALIARRIRAREGGR